MRAFAVVWNVLIVAGTWLCLPSGAASAQERIECRADEAVEATCGLFACVPDPHSSTGHACGRCRYSQDPADDQGSLDCGGGNCTSDGLCERPNVVPPEPIRPSFHLLIASLSLPVGDAEGANLKPLMGAGYLYELALSETSPYALDDGGFATPNPPRWYGHLGAELEMAGPAQNLFAALGLSYYLPGVPLLTTIGVQGLYQRTGASIWKLGDSDENSNRLGPALELGVLHNVFLRAAWLFPLAGPNEEQALMLSLIYMQNLLSDLLPDRYLAALPALGR